MKKLLIVAAGAAIIGYLLLRRKRIESEELSAPAPTLNKKNHHLTNVFANAKKHAVHATN